MDVTTSEVCGGTPFALDWCNTNQQQNSITTYSRSDSESQEYTYISANYLTHAPMLLIRRRTGSGTDNENNYYESATIQPSPTGGITVSYNPGTLITQYDTTYELWIEGNVVLTWPNIPPAGALFRIRKLAWTEGGKIIVFHLESDQGQSGMYGYADGNLTTLDVPVAFMYNLVPIAPTR
jgi:hypothetical protein